jgi:hypothetical protein
VDQIIRFEQELGNDHPDLRVGDPNSVRRHPILGSLIVDANTCQMILMEEANQWSLTRYLVIELSEWSLKFFIEDRGRLPIIGVSYKDCSDLQIIRIQRACKEIGIHRNHYRVANSNNPYELYTKLELLETAPREIAERVMWNLFWELEIEPSFQKPEESWLYPYAKYFLKQHHDLIHNSRMDAVHKVMTQ